MAFLKVGGEPPKKKQRLYLMEIELPSGMHVCKFGKASGLSSKERMQQINGSIFDKFRYTAKIGIKRDREVDADLVFKYENTLHKFFATYKYEHTIKWDGVNECFTIPLDDAVMAYEAVIDGQVPDYLYVLPTMEDQDKLPF